MLTKRIIPCLDVKAGRVVKGVKFKDHRDAGDPVELAEHYDRQGADEVVFYDITASSEERGIMLDVVRRTAEKLFHSPNRWRRPAHRRGHEPHAQGRRRQGFHKHRRRG